MQYISTRGGMQPASFAQILIAGLAPDGGLTVPVALPRLELAQIEAFRDLSYPQLAAEIISIYWPEIAKEKLLELTHAAYGTQFMSPQIVPVTTLWQNFGLADLSGGPTLAFKDMAMQFLGQAIPHVLQETGQKLNIVGATSGDTGSAAEYAFRGQPNTSVFMLSPLGRMSDFQRAQMYSLTDPNIHNIVVDGVFDDCQTLMKQLGADLEFKQRHSLGAVNSINFGRIAAQSVYYFWLWLRHTDQLAVTDRANITVDVTVPSGNFGNVLSGYYAKKLGAPIGKLVVATNENNVLFELFTTGVYRPRGAAETHITSSPSMDISKASNVERFIYDLLGADSSALNTAFAQLESTGSLDLRAHLPRFAEEFAIFAHTSNHQNRLETIKTVYDRTGVIIDPHTADGVHCALPFATAGTPMYVLETAKPQKFAPTVTEAIGVSAPLTPEMQQLLALPQHTTQMAADQQALREFIAKHAV